MYAPSGWVTTLVMLPVLRMERDHLTGAGGIFRSNSSGIGDLKLQTLWRLVVGWQKAF